MGSWFPIANSQIENEQFQSLTTTEKLYFWQILSEFNLNGGQFFKTDMWFAATLKLSEIKIRVARRKLSAMGFIDIVPGKIKGRLKLSTTYKNVYWHKVPEDERFMQMNRPTFETLVDYIRSGHYTHEDIVTFVFASYLVWSKGGVYAEVTKSEFLSLTGIGNSIKCLEKLYSKFKFRNGEPLFNLTVGYRTIRIEDVQTVAFNEEHWKRRIAEVDKLVDNMRDKVVKKEKARARQEGDIFAEDLLPLFKELHIKYKGQKPTIGNNNYEQKLAGLGDPALVARAIDKYFNSELPSGLVNYSIHTFIKYADRYLS